MKAQRRIWSCGPLLLVALVAACTSNVVVARRVASHPSTEPAQALAASATPPAAPSASPGPLASASPATPASPAGASPAATPSALPSPALAVLAKPTTPVRTLAGTITIDARYAADAAGGRLVTDHGSLVVSFGGSVISDGGSNAISNHGANLISDGGGQAIGWDVGGLPGTYRLTQAEAAAVGTLSPAAGMALRVRDLETNQYVSLGVGPDGKPAYEVLSDAAGHYEVYPPLTISPTMLVVSRVPGATGDPRLQYDVLSGGDGVAIDEDTVKSTRFLRLTCSRGWLDFFRSDHATRSFATMVDDAELAAVGAGHVRIDQAVTAAHADELPDAVKVAKAQQMADIVLAHLDLAGVPIDRIHATPPYTGPDESAFDAYVGVMRSFRELVTDREREIVAEGQDPVALVNARPYLVKANQGLAQPWVIKKPADFVEFFMMTYVVKNDPSSPIDYAGEQAALDDVKARPDDIARYSAATRGYALAMDRLVYVQHPELIDQLVAVIQAPAPSPSPASN